MSHVAHEGPEDAILYDGCPECDARAADPMGALLHMDPENVDRLWRRMLRTERREFGEGEPGGYRSDNEARVGRLLYFWAVFEERHAAWLTPDTVWDPERYAVKVM